MSLKGILGRLAAGSFGLKVVTVLLALLGVPYIVMGVALFVFVIWRLAVLAAKVRGENYWIDETPAEKAKRYLDADTVPVKLVP